MDKMINGSVTTIEKNEAKLKYVCATIVFKKNKFLNTFKQCLMYENSYLQWHERIFFLLFIHLSLAYLFQIIDQIIILDKDDLNKYKRFFNNLIY